MSKLYSCLFANCCAILSMGFSLSVSAQVQDTDSLRQIQLSEVVVSALRLPFRENSVPYGISKIESRTNTQGLSLKEDLADLPGIEVNARYNFAVGDRITNRGFGARTQFGVRGVRILLNDMPVTFADGQSNLEMIDLQDLSYVELLKGPGSSLYGNASGGVLILHTNPIYSGEILSSVSTTMGSQGLSRWNAGLAGQIEKTRIEGSFSDFHYNGFRDHASANYNRSILKVVSSLSQTDVLHIYGGYVDFNGLNPGSLTKQEVQQNPRMANPSSISNAAAQDGKQGQIAATWKHQKDSVSSFKMTAYGIRRSVVNPIIGKIVVLPQNSGGWNALYNSELNLLGKSIDWNAGVEMAARFNFRKNYTNNKGARGDLTINQDEQIIGTGIFLQAFAPLTKRIDMDGSFRYDRTFFKVTDHLTNSNNINNSGSRWMNGASPSFGFVYHFPIPMNFFANFSTSFETPTSTELANRPDGAGGFNPGLNPSHALEYEAGIRGSLDRLFKYDLTGYIIRTKDDLIPFQVPSSPGQDYYKNAGSTIHQGGEIDLQFLPLEFIDVTSSFTYIDAHFKNFVEDGTNESGNKIPGITPIRGALELKFHSIHGFYCSALMQSFGKVYVDDANTASTNPYSIFDLGIGHEGISFGKIWNMRLRISGGVSNVFNVRYISAVTVNAAANRYYEPGQERSFYVNARLEFGKP